MGERCGGEPVKVVTALDDRDQPVLGVFMCDGEGQAGLPDVPDSARECAYCRGVPRTRQALSVTFLTAI